MMADALLAKALPKAQPTKTKTQTIKTQRLILREARIYDLAAFHELYSNKEVMEYWYVIPEALNANRLSKNFP